MFVFVKLCMQGIHGKEIMLQDIKYPSSKIVLDVLCITRVFNKRIGIGTLASKNKCAPCAADKLQINRLSTAGLVHQSVYSQTCLA